MKDIRLRIATMKDAAFLLAVRNDPLTRAMSRYTEPIPEGVHLMWLEETLASKHNFLYVATLFGAVPVGTGRADFGAHDVQFSLAVDPTHRGRGYGQKIVHELCQVADGTSGLPQVAEISTKNVPSTLAFLAEGFEPTEVLDDNRLLPSGEASARRWLWVRRESQAGGRA